MEYPSHPQGAFPSARAFQCRWRLYWRRWLQEPVRAWRRLACACSSDHRGPGSAASDRLCCSPPRFSANRLHQRLSSRSRVAAGFARRPDLSVTQKPHEHEVSGENRGRRPSGSVAERAYRSLQVATVNDARHAPVLAIADRSPQDAQLADPQSPPGRSSLQCAIVRVGRQRLVGEHAGHCAQGCAVVVGVELA